MLTSGAFVSSGCAILRANASQACVIQVHKYLKTSLSFRIERPAGTLTCWYTFCCKCRRTSRISIMLTNIGSSGRLITPVLAPEFRISEFHNIFMVNSTRLRR